MLATITHRIFETNSGFGVGWHTAGQCWRGFHFAVGGWGGGGGVGTGLIFHGG